MLSVTAIVGYVASRQFPSKSRKPNGFEYFVLLTCIDLIIQGIFTIFNKLMSEDDFSEARHTTAASFSAK